MKYAALLPVSLVAALLSPSPGGAGETGQLGDAPLHAVQLVDKDVGWAVGEEGVIWHTIDGGAHWERQPSGVKGSLRSIFMHNAYVGWIAGREESVSGTAGIVLFTRDGGVKWQRLLVGTLPGLNVVRFASEQVGYLAGDGTPQYPSGVFGTTDGGRTWKPIPGPRCPTWLAAAFTPDGTGSLAGAWNRLATAKPDKVTAIDHDPLGGRNLRGMHFLGGRGIAVGQGGLVLLSKVAGGSSWHFAELPLEPATRAAWDFHAVHGVGKRIWAVGRPGSAVLHSRDEGVSWEVQRTGQPLPLNGVFFLDEERGWAVGELGMVLATKDGGKTWQVQRRGGQQAAVLLLHARGKDVPFGTLAHLGGHEGYLTAVLQLTGPDHQSEDLARAAEPARLGSAVRQAGGAAGEVLWQLPLPGHLVAGSRGELVEAWNRHHGGRAAEEILRQLVLTLRVWRPQVVLTDCPDHRQASSTAEALLVEAVREAFRNAGSTQAFPEQNGILGLEPWQPARLYAICHDRERAQVTLDLTQISPQLEASPREHGAAALALLSPGEPSIPRLRCYRLLEGAEGAAQARALMQGIRVAPGGLARRPIVSLEEPDAELMKAARQGAQLTSLVENPSDLANPERLLTQVGPMIEQMPVDRAARAAHLVASQLARAGHLDLAREVYQLLIDRYPAHPLAVDACRWLIRHNSSSETRRRHELGQLIIASEQAHGQKGVGEEKISLPVFSPDRGKEGGSVRQVSIPRVETQNVEQMVFLTSRREKRKWFEGCVELGERLAAHGPLHATDPALQLCIQAARRRLGDVETPRKWYADFVARTSDGVWREAAASELWLTHRSGQPPRPLALCRRTETRPFLDGSLDEECWKKASAWVMQEASGATLKEYPTEVRLAHDRDFLYLALRCFHPAGRQAEVIRPRRHDEDYRQHDRVSLHLDLDRDYSTCFQLQIDQRGCVAESCWGDRSWDPRWFVAVRSEPRVWIVEAAIPLGALTGDAILPGQAWACNVVRVVPGQGSQAFSLPAGTPEEGFRPEGMGLLIFHEDGKREPAPLQQPASMPPAP